MAINHDFKWSVMKVLTVILLKPYLFSMTKLSYTPNGMFIISEKRPTIRKKIRLIIIIFPLKVLAKLSAKANPPVNMTISITARLMDDDHNDKLLLSF